MHKYEKACFAAWADTIDATVAAGMQQPILRQCQEAAAADETSGSELREAQTGDGAGSRGVEINFRPGLLEIMREAKHLGHLGFEVPQAAVNLALQEGQLR
jgi:hypothetical protein